MLENSISTESNHLPNKPNEISQHVFRVAIIAIILSIISIVFSALNYQSLSHRNHDLHTVLQSNLNLQGTTNTLTAQWQDQLSRTQQLETAMASLENNSALQLQNTLIELRYLIQLAHLHLIIDNDKSGALQILQMAQNSLVTVQSNQLLPLKNALQSDIQQLLAAPSIDTNAVFQKLAAINRVTQALSPLPDHAQLAISPLNTVQNNTAHFPWYERLWQSLKQVKNFIVINRIEEPSIPLTSLDHIVFLKENIQLNIQMAQWALLHRNETVYQASLKAVYDWLKQYFSINPAILPVLTDIQTLQAMHIHQTLPTLDKSLQALSMIQNLPKSLNTPSKQTPVKTGSPS